MMMMVVSRAQRREEEEEEEKKNFFLSHIFKIFFCKERRFKSKIKLHGVYHSTHGMLSPISPLPFMSAETRSLEKIGSLFCMWTLSIAHKTPSSNLGTLASKYFTVSFNWSMDV
jgi:hypothetical protein